ncbi:MAG: hypothetical protein AB7O43_05175 [Hyphomicrobiaceae bacterium]
MNGGTMRSASRLALLAVAGVMAGAVSAQAADLGGNCCADLEERVAELEATTVRKGNRKVSLQLYGQVSQALVFWDDGGETNTYLLENNAVKNRLGVRGSAKITSDWSAGYNIELQIRSGRSSSANQLPLATTEGSSITVYNTRSVSLRSANWFINSNAYGRITVGRTSDASAGTGTINLASPDGFAANGYVLGRSHQGFFLRRSGTKGNAGLSDFKWTNAWHRNYDDLAQYDYAGNNSVVKYTSPFFLGQSKRTGLQFQTAWGRDDTWTAGLRYVEDFGTFRLAAGVGYLQDTSRNLGQCTNLGDGTSGVNNVSNVDCSMWQASASIMHVPTGLYVSGGYGELTDNQRHAEANRLVAGLANQISDKDSSWWVQAGWVAKLNSLGKTTFWGTYASFESSGNVANGSSSTTSASLRTLGGGDVLNPFGATDAFVKTAEATIWGFGVTQDIDAAAMKLYLGYSRSSADFTLINSATLAEAKSNSVDDIDIIYTGATIKF